MFTEKSRLEEQRRNSVWRGHNAKELLNLASDEHKLDLGEKADGFQLQVIHLTFSFYCSHKHPLSFSSPLSWLVIS